MFNIKKELTPKLYRGSICALLCVLGIPFAGLIGINTTATAGWIVFLIWQVFLGLWGWSGFRKEGIELYAGMFVLGLASLPLIHYQLAWLIIPFVFLAWGGSRMTDWKKVGRIKRK